MNKYVLVVSYVLNAAFLMILFGVVPFFLYLSITINLGLMWYIRNTLKVNKALEDDVTDIMEKINTFSDHISTLYELEMYYGDQNLESLLIHSRQLVNDFVDFQENYYDVEVEDEQTDEEVEDEQNNEEA
tara:strand:+ start:73 stop:462 length:390 start_codon:yes stop_codon:yes gene_type:complete